MRSRPDVLVLGGGGVLGLEWMMGLLGGIEDIAGFDLRECEYLIGTSAGSILAARLVGGRRPRRPDGDRQQLDLPSVEAELPEEEDLEEAPGVGATVLHGARRAGEWTLAVGSPLAPIALGVARPAGTLLRAGVLSRIHAPDRTLDDLNARVQQYGAGFDGRLRVACVDRANGQRVIFGAPGAPPATVGEAVAASCAVPWLFAPVTISGREYVDGGVWSSTNLDAAPVGLDTHVLCLNPTAGITGHHTLVGVARRLARSAVSVEALALRRRGAIVRTVAPDTEAAAAMGGDFMDSEPRPRVLAAGYAQGHRVGSEIGWA
ncbi:MAG: patatin-like phospholipase family protein [Solirubrobacterales bacterium]|nr:patatin-like phospholipase family protein [Solirubrobacterales bacterium]